MPIRKTVLANDEIYHVFNRGINKQPTFISTKNYQRAVLALKFYQLATPPSSLSKVLNLPADLREKVLKDIEIAEKQVEIICFCLMPNHFHFLLKQKKDRGISKFMSNFQNSYTRYFNTKDERDGSIFLTQFKAVRIVSDEHLIHVSRYIHLNPYTGYVVKSLKELENYPWSSFKDYLKNKNDFVVKDLIAGFFKTPDDYKKFVFDQADYQRMLKEMEHLVLE